MEILFVSHKYPPAVGGMEKQSFELINGMKQLAKVHSIVYDGYGSRLKFFARLNKRIIAVCKQHPAISIIHYNDGLMAAVCSGHRGYTHLKRVVTLHGLDVVFPNKLFRKYILPRFNSFNLIIAVSNATAKACVNLGINADKIVVINNGVDVNIANSQAAIDFDNITERFGLQVAGKKVLVTMGRPVKRKGFSWFIKNVVPLLHGDFVLLMIGPFSRKATRIENVLNRLPEAIRRQIELLLGYPTDEREIRKLLATEAVNNRITHLGKLPLDELITVLRNADAFVMPNIKVEGDMEGFGLVCLEACLCGALVYAADIDGIPDAICNGKNGILVKAENANEWAAQLNNLLAGPVNNLISKEERIAYTTHNFGWQKMVADYYKSFLNTSTLIALNFVIAAITC